MVMSFALKVMQDKPEIGQRYKFIGSLVGNHLIGFISLPLFHLPLIGLCLKTMPQNLEMSGIGVLFTAYGCTYHYFRSYVHEIYSNASFKTEMVMKLISP